MWMCIFCISCICVLSFLFVVCLLWYFELKWSFVENCLNLWCYLTMCVQSAPTCCWPTMHRWKWRMLRDGAPLQRPSAMETDRWVSVREWGELLVVTPEADLPPSLLHTGMISVLYWNQSGFEEQGSCDLQMQINSCSCTFFHTAASRLIQWC